MSATKLEQALFNGPRRAAAESVRAEGMGFVKEIYIDGTTAQGSGDNPGFCVPALASQLSFDVMVNNAGGGYSVCQRVGFSNPTPTQYKVQVRWGERVWIGRTAGLMEFCVPWMPYVKPCPGAAASNAASRFGRKKRGPFDAVGPAVPTGGGDGIPSDGSGGAGTSPGDGSGTGTGGIGTAGGFGH